jgi:hypothetical protein
VRDRLQAIWVEEPRWEGSAVKCESLAESAWEARTMVPLSRVWASVLIFLILIANWTSLLASPRPRSLVAQATSAPASARALAIEEPSVDPLVETLFRGESPSANALFAPQNQVSEIENGVGFGSTRLFTSESSVVGPVASPTSTPAVTPAVKKPIAPPAPPSQTFWFYREASIVKGPVSTAVIRRLYNQGRLKANSEILLEGVSSWRPLLHHEELANLREGHYDRNGLSLIQSKTEQHRGMSATIRIDHAASFGFVASLDGFIVSPEARDDSSELSPTTAVPIGFEVEYELAIGRYFSLCGQFAYQHIAMLVDGGFAYSDRGGHRVRGTVGLRGRLPLKNGNVELMFDSLVGGGWIDLTVEKPGVFEPQAGDGFVVHGSLGARWWLSERTGLWLRLGGAFWLVHGSAEIGAFGGTITTGVSFRFRST